MKRMAHPHTPDILIIPERDWVIFDPGVSNPNVIAHHGPQYPSDVNIVQIYSGPGIKFFRPQGLNPVVDQREELPLLPFGYPIGFVPAASRGVTQ